MGWTEIWALLLKIVGNLHDPGSWKVSKDGAATGPVTDSTFTPTDIHLEFTDGGATVTLDAKPGSPDHADVYLNDALLPDAELVVTIKSQPPLKPLIVVLEFENVSGSTYRFDHPK